jgi:AcrR family transcriptional regulator
MLDTNTNEAAPDTVPEGAGRERGGLREELLQTAVDLFATRGFKGTSIRDIAKTLGVSVSVIYHYFGNKEGLWSAILDYSVKGLPARLETALAGGGHALERFRRVLRAHLAASALYQKESKIFLIDYDRMSAAGDQTSKAIQKRVLDAYVGILEEMHAEGLVKSSQTKILAFNVLGVVNWYLRWYRPDGPLAPDEVYEEIVAFVLYGVIGTPPGQS